VPSAYLHKLETGSGEAPPIQSERIDSFLRSHFIEPKLLREDAFTAFMVDRQAKAVTADEDAIGQSAYGGDEPEEGEDAESEDETAKRS
jgi:hypothetical protein